MKILNLEELLASRTWPNDQEYDDFLKEQFQNGLREIINQFKSNVILKEINQAFLQPIQHEIDELFEQIKYHCLEKITDSQGNEVVRMEIRIHCGRLVFVPIVEGLYDDPKDKKLDVVTTDTGQ